MSLVRLQNVTKRYEDRLILREVSLRLEAGERIGLIGQNGAGKTTILRLVLGREQPSEGRVDINLGIRIGYFSQFSELDGTASVQTALEGLFSEARAIEAELASVAEALETVTDGDEMEKLLERQSFLFEEINRLDGWEYPRYIDTALTKLGFTAEQRAQPVDQLSGGWRNRAALAKIVLEAPDVLLLDEPTNFLDVEGVAWLEGWLRTFTGGLLLVSHDRQFLDVAATHIMEVENYHLHDYPGNYTNYIRKRPFREHVLNRQFENEEELITLEAEAIADRQELSQRPSESLRRKLADIKKRRPPRPVDEIVTSIYQGLRAPDRLCRVEHVSKAFGERSLFNDLSFEIGREDRVAIVGRNGCGKSTLLKVLNGKEVPDSGKVYWESGVSFADFNEIESQLNLKDTVTHAVNSMGGQFSMAGQATRKQVNRFLTLLRFSEMDLNQKIGTLSGGQRARVALAQCLLSGSAALLLDEPTNHLDLSTTQVMEQALLHFPGAVIVVSHDRFFLDKIATRLLVFEGEGKVQEVSGNWTTWQASLNTSVSG